VLDTLADCRTVAFDKTGTLTTGILSLSSFTGLQASAAQNGNNASTNGVLPALPGG
jgi:cation transport ATPase